MVGFMLEEQCRRLFFLNLKIQLIYNYVSVNCFPDMCKSCFDLSYLDCKT